MSRLVVVTVSAAGLIAVVLAAARDLPRGAIVRYTVSLGAGVIVTMLAVLLVHPEDRAFGGLVVFAASLLLATHGHPVRLADSKFFDEIGIEPPATLLTPNDTRRVQRRFIIYVLLLTALLFVFL
jgi:hypothetical protein